MEFGFRGNPREGLFISRYQSNIVVVLQVIMLGQLVRFYAIEGGREGGREGRRMSIPRRGLGSVDKSGGGGGGIAAVPCLMQPLQPRRTRLYFESCCVFGSQLL